MADSEMTKPAQRPKLGLIINAALVALAFGLLGLVIWRNRDKIREVFSHPLDLPSAGGWRWRST